MFRNKIIQLLLVFVFSTPMSTFAFTNTHNDKIVVGNYYENRVWFGCYTENIARKLVIMEGMTSYSDVDFRNVMDNGICDRYEGSFKVIAILHKANQEITKRIVDIDGNNVNITVSFSIIVAHGWRQNGEKNDNLFVITRALLDGEAISDQYLENNVNLF